MEPGPSAQGNCVRVSHTEVQGVRLQNAISQPAPLPPRARPGADCVIRLSWQSGRCHTDARLHYRPVPGSVAFSTRVNTSDSGTNKGKWQLLRTPGQGTAPNPSAVTSDPPKPRCLMRVPRLRTEIFGAKVIIREGKLCRRR